MKSFQREPDFEIVERERVPLCSRTAREAANQRRPFPGKSGPGYLGGHHCEYFDLEGKRKRAATDGVNAWIDPEGYRRFIASKRRAFEGEVDLEMGVTSAAKK
jgi:hypothetical protein